MHRHVTYRLTAPNPGVTWANCCDAGSIKRPAAPRQLPAVLTPKTALSRPPSRQFGASVLGLPGASDLTTAHPFSPASLAICNRQCRSLRHARVLLSGGAYQSGGKIAPSPRPRGRSAACQPSPRTGTESGTITCPKSEMHAYRASRLTTGELS